MSSQQYSQQSSQYGDSAQRDRRPTLPPIREMFGGTRTGLCVMNLRGLLNVCAAELSQPVAHHHSQGRPSSSSTSQQMPRGGQTVDDRVPRAHGHGGAPPPGGQQLPPGYPNYPASGVPAAQPRNPADATYRPSSQHGYPSYSHPPPLPRHIDPNALATSGYPYAVSQPQYTMPQTMGGPSSGVGRGAQDGAASGTIPGRYECDWCGKGFTRPSSLKVSSGSRYVILVSHLKWR